MAAHSPVQQITASWNPVTGCTKVSPGCAHCYAERYARWLREIGQPRYRNGFRLTLHEDLVELPLTWKSPRRVFTASMADIFHEDVPSQFIERIFATMEAARWHAFQVLTKRADRLAELAPRLPWPENVAIGVSVESDEYTWRIDRLREVPARVRFLCLEPLLGPIPDLDLRGIDRVVVGTESGPAARPMNPDWVWDIRRQCLASRVGFHLKRPGGLSRRPAGRTVVRPNRPPAFEPQMSLQLPLLAEA